jgi:hypothetical protein
MLTHILPGILEKKFLLGKGYYNWFVTNLLQKLQLTVMYNPALFFRDQTAYNVPDKCQLADGK